MSVAGAAATPSGSILSLFGGETDSSGTGTGGVGHIGDCGNWGIGLISGVDMESIAISISIAASGAEGDLGGVSEDDLVSFMEFTIFSKFASDWSASCVINSQ